MADELARWAAERAPGLLSRAEAEAVGVLRDALLDAALRPKPEPKRAAAPPPRKTEMIGEALWAYCVTRAGEPLPDGLEGVHGGRLSRVASGDLAALVSRVPLAEFAEEPLRSNLNDLDWLERVAREHEGVLEGALAASTIVPLRLCTIYENEASVRRMLQDERESLGQALELLDGRQEWGIKLLADREKLMQAARAGSEQFVESEDEPEGGGGAYMLRRRQERQVRQSADDLAAEVAEDVHARLQGWATDAVTRPPQNRDLSGHEGDMLLNAAYLVPAERVDGMRELVAQLEKRHEPLGVRLELTGPWPPYNFVPGADAATIA